MYVDSSASSLDTLHLSYMCISQQHDSTAIEMMILLLQLFRWPPQGQARKVPVASNFASKIQHHRSMYHLPPQQEVFLLSRSDFFAVTSHRCLYGMNSSNSIEMTASQHRSGPP
mmetsp:Transcript_30518/g.89211  ORF Transcript_30518/g.89211 Transcript_30518/m.89211 type:complete len:114 (+) Transcript_30518:47-388(+)